MEFVKEYWWCFLILVLVIAFAITGLIIGHKDSNTTKLNQIESQNKNQQNNKNELESKSIQENQTKVKDKISNKKTTK